MQYAYRPVVLCILDGWGERSERADNAVLQAETPNWNRYRGAYPQAHLQASEGHVGLPGGQMGNSEVGHMNLGAGRVVMQDLPRIDHAIETGELAKNPTLLKALDGVKKAGGRLHILGLLSPGGVHSHQDHMAVLSNIAAEHGVEVLVHAFLDGRDTPPKSAAPYLAAFQAKAPKATIATVCGRYFAMDRDKNWDRVVQAWTLLVQGKGAHAGTAADALEAAYAAGKSDEFVPATAIAGYDGMKDGDAILMANFRADRARQLLSTLLDPAFDGFERPRLPAFSAKLGLTSYSSAHDKLMDAVFPPQELTATMGETVSKAGLKQLRIAETEKYAHVTFFFNGGEERVFPGEERILVPSPKVATYDLQPEMSAPEVTDRLVDAIDNKRFDYIVVNFANTDMVGHTGDLKAAIKAVETVDNCLGRLESAILKAGGAMLVTADHGNAEEMKDDTTGQAHTAHTLNPVPFILIASDTQGVKLEDGILADVAPSCLDLLGLPKPKAMTGRSLIHRADARAAE